MPFGLEKVFAFCGLRMAIWVGKAGRYEIDQLLDRGEGDSMVSVDSVKCDSGGPRVALNQKRHTFLS